MDNLKKWNIIHVAYKKYLQDCKQRNVNANSFGNWLKNNYVAPQPKAIQVQAGVKVNFAEVIENKKKQIYKSLSEYLGEAEVPVHRIVLLNLMAENECRICDEILADIKSKISA